MTKSHTAHMHPSTINQLQISLQNFPRFHKYSVILKGIDFLSKSMHLFLQLLLVSALASIFYFFLFQARRRNGRKSVHPPGPVGIPLIGNLYGFTSFIPHLYLYELSKTYGPLMSLKLGFLPTLVVSSAKMARVVMKTHDESFSDRPMLATIRKLSYNGSDLAFAPYGSYWREIRRFCILHFFSSKKVQSFASIREEVVSQMTHKISQLSGEGKPVDFSEVITWFTITVVCRIAFGRSYTRCGNSSAVEILREAQDRFVGFCFSDYFPCIGWIDKFTGTEARTHKLFMELDGFYQEIIDEHLNRDRTKSGQEDIVDMLLKLQGENSLGIDITTDHIKGILMNIFLAGTDTTAATLDWAMIELMKNPKVRKRLQDEARTLKRNKQRDIIKEEDLEELGYLKAVIKETLRLHPASPLLVPRQTTQNCSVEGYEIQGKALVLINVWAIGRDPECWERPEEFEPERFVVDKAVDLKGQHFELIPFGSGRRICPGIQFAAVMVELALANLICLFDWELPVGMEKEVLDMNILPGITPRKKNPLCLLAKMASQ